MSVTLYFVCACSFAVTVLAREVLVVQKGQVVFATFLGRLTSFIIDDLATKFLAEDPL